MFIGREKELSILKERLESNKFELGIIYGQRRIGKTSLIMEATKGYDCIYFLSRIDSYYNNLQYFANEFSKYAGIPYTPNFDNFDDLFNSLINYIGNKKTTIIIDELPFLANAYPGIISYLQDLSDDLKRNNSSIKIILSGSDMSFMIDLLNNRAKPLYQRVTFKVHVKEMVFSDAVKMLSGTNKEDAIKYLSIFGNRPYYLDMIDKNKDFKTNIIDLCFSNTSILIDAPNITLPIGYSSNSVYISILIAIANHKQRVKEISDYLKMDSNATSTYLGRMLAGESKFIQKQAIYF